MSSASVQRQGSSTSRGGAFEAGRDDFPVVSEVDVLGCGWLGFVVKQVDMGLGTSLPPSVVGAV
jgi:hypothetical protein